MNIMSASPDLCCGTVPRNKGQVEIELDMLDKEIASLGDALSRMENRISVVLRKMPCAPENAATKCDPLVCAADAIRSKRWVVASFYQRVNSMIERCEL